MKNDLSLVFISFMLIGFEFVWRLTYLLFNATRFWFYRFLAAIIAIPLALLWAIIFAFINLGTVWCCTPSLRIFDIIIHYLHRVWLLSKKLFSHPKSCYCVSNAINQIWISDLEWTRSMLFGPVLQFGRINRE